MPRFNKNNIEELKEFLYNSHDHDAKLKNAKYDSGEDSLKIELYNPIFKVKIDLTFHNIGIAFAVKGEWTGSRETPVSKDSLSAYIGADSDLNLTALNPVQLLCIKGLSLN